MDNFIVSARKYRPATFKTVVGQESITTTLKNAIRNNHLAQAFLFCGPRGVGKTTCARILAKTINCTNLTPDTEGCNECESCISFNNGQSLNIYELDAASNNSVDDIRSLVEQVRYPPHSGKFKIYIIDEVHMLSASAFNAFLKTLEEPPPYAIFILATTEKHKIIPTILSRCQIFDFNRITIEDITQQLTKIAASEGVTAEPEALLTIAQKADGALRDALSIFDQIVSYAGNNVTYKHVIENLNVLDYEYYFRITDLLKEGDFPSALLVLDELLSDGFDIHHFVAGLGSHFRDLLVCKDPQTIRLLEVGEKTKEKYLAQSQRIATEVLYRYLEIANRCDVDFKMAQNQRLHTELALLKMCHVTVVTFSRETHSTGPNVAKQEVTKEVSPKTEIKSTSTSSRQNEISEPTVTEKKSLADKQEKTAISPGSSFEKKTSSPGTISITRKLNQSKIENESQKEKADELPVKNKSFSEQELIAAIKNYADQVLAGGKKQLAVTLKKHKPVLLDNAVIEIPVDNPIQAEDVNASKSDIQSYLRQQFENTFIEVKARLVEEGEGEETAYTPGEKFKKMAEKNPDLNQFKQQFGLELDF